ncbi:hypothetical protein IIC_04371 [Bacillus cereus VD021]|uniref:Transposase putative helix-turn-helix domain-containing protein n=1 Tax=Bacillus cereus VD021 TaxID=1053224 RepID=R8HFF8_BACCE|nr:hypothetical protein IIC_04371 [Bacillus cereus VD021]
MTLHNKAYIFRLYPAEQQAHLICNFWVCAICIQ